MCKEEFSIFSGHFLLKALQAVTAYISFPFISVNSIILSTIAGYVIFSENAQKKK